MGDAGEGARDRGAWRPVVGRTPAQRTPEPVDRGLAEYSALLHPPEDFHAGQEHSLRRVLRHRAQEQRGGLYPGGAWLRCLRTDGGHYQQRRDVAPVGLAIVHRLKLLPAISADITSLSAGKKTWFLPASP